MSNSMWPHRRQTTRLPRPWDSPGKNTGVGCHFLLQCMKVKSEREVAQLCRTLSDPMDCSLSGSSAHGIFQARLLELGAIAFSHIYLYLPIHTHTHMYISQLFKKYNIFKNCIKCQQHMIYLCLYFQKKCKFFNTVYLSFPGWNSNLVLCKSLVL